MKANQFRAMMLVLLMAVVSLGVVNAQTLTVTGTVTDVADGTPIMRPIHKFWFEASRHT